MKITFVEKKGVQKIETTVDILETYFSCIEQMHIKNA